MKVFIHSENDNMFIVEHNKKVLNTQYDCEKKLYYCDVTDDNHDNELIIKTYNLFDTKLWWLEILNIFLKPFIFEIDGRKLFTTKASIKLNALEMIELSVSDETITIEGDGNDNIKLETCCIDKHYKRWLIANVIGQSAFFFMICLVIMAILMITLINKSYNYMSLFWLLGLVVFCMLGIDKVRKVLKKGHELYQR